MKRCLRKIIGMLLSVVLPVLITGCGMQTVRVTAAGTGMGTVVQETIYVENEEEGKTILAQVEQYVQNYETEVLSWRVESSELAQINATAGRAEGVVLSERMALYLNTIWELSEASGGALDVTVGQVTELWNLDKWAVQKKSGEAFKVPSEGEITTLLASTGYEKVILAEGCIFLPEHMKLDLGAVGKGIVCDEIGTSLKEKGTVRGAVITLGGSVVTYGSKPDGSPWQVAIAHPREDGKYLGTLSLTGENYIATSGDYERYVEKDGIRYHHIMNPHTGYPVDNELCSVTIVSNSGLLSDALSTACFVLGTENGMVLAEQFGAEALFVTKESELVMTEGMKEYFSLSR